MDCLPAMQLRLNFGNPRILAGAGIGATHLLRFNGTDPLDPRSALRSRGKTIDRRSAKVYLQDELSPVSGVVRSEDLSASALYSRGKILYVRIRPCSVRSRLDLPCHSLGF